jgi:putative transposase
MLVLIAALRDGRKIVLAVESGYRESIESWAALLRDLKARGLRAPRLVIADGHLGIWGAVTTVFPEVDEQRCWNHRVPGRARSKEVRRPPAGKTFTPASQRQVVAA